jgi:hypothetical protein
MYDIIYSITFHQSLDFVNHFLKNIEKYDVKNNYLIVIHLSDNLYEKKDQIYKKNVLINPIHYNKKLSTHLLLKPFIENFEYLITQNIKFNNFMTLSSSNRFVREAPKFELDESPLCENKIVQDIDELKLRTWYWWPKFLKNKKIVEVFQSNKIKLINGQVSGRLYSKNVIEKICDFIRKKKILDLIEREVVFEEIIFPSLANYYMDKEQKVYCHTFWGKPRCIPNVNDVYKILEENPHIYIIKRFPDDLNNILFKKILGD